MFNNTLWLALFKSGLCRRIREAIARASSLLPPALVDAWAGVSMAVCSKESVPHAPKQRDKSGEIPR